MTRLVSLNSYHYRRGGSDVVYFEHDALFADLGWDTAMFAMHHPLNVESRWSEYFAQELEFGFSYNALDTLVRAGRVIYSMDARRQMQRLIRDFKPTVAHAHCIYHHLSPSVLSALKDAGVPVVMTAHDLKLACPAYKMLNDTGICEKCRGGNVLHVAANRCIRGSLGASMLVMLESAVHKSLGMYRKNLDRVVVPSRFFQNKLVEWGWSEEQIAYIPNFVDMEHLTPRPVTGNSVLYFGRLAPEKGVDTLMHAAATAGVALNIAGTGPSEDELKALASTIDGDITFLGRLEKDAVEAAITASRVVVLPSRWYENAPMSVLESYGLGRTVIGARIGGIPELVQEGETGFLFDVDNIDQLTDLLRKVASMPDAALTQMGHHASDWVREQFSLNRYRSSMLELYGELGVSTNLEVPHGRTA